MTPADITNQALDSIGVESSIGDLQEGSKEARAALRWYGPTLRQLLRAANWNFARKEAKLTLLNDRTGQTTQQQVNNGWPQTVGTGTPGMGPWIYEYEWPIDGMRARFLPMQGCFNGQDGGSTVPLMPGLATTPIGMARQIPARFLVTQDTIPTMIGLQQSWADRPDLADIQGRGPNQQTVVLTNVKDARLVYTALIIYPQQWDVLFRQAFVATLASYLALPVLADKKMALAMRAQQVAIAKEALTAARIADGDEGWFTTDHQPDWLRSRSSGGWGGPWGGPGGDLGVLGYGWDSMSLGDGSAF